ncbi:hypothetical protein WISP_52739 [Willisornis vidua]|uniref:Uncharacterized protein n=1 Tax=Willisornis vidua TaxID=1566151 RepID=A0ABQ9DD48_9PASS|nr:hypothetical protein WISP_52739 [Willisornis vidua]
MRHCSTDYDLMESDIQSTLSPPHCPLIQSTLPEFAHENVVGDSIKSLTEFEIGNIHCSSLIHPGSCFIFKDDQVLFPSDSSKIAEEDKDLKSIIVILLAVLLPLHQILNS